MRKDSTLGWPRRRAASAAMDALATAWSLSLHFSPEPLVDLALPLVAALPARQGEHAVAVGRVEELVRLQVAFQAGVFRPRSRAYFSRSST